MANLNEIMDYLADSNTVEITEPTINVTRGKATDIVLYRMGRLCLLTMNIQSTASTTSGSNMFEGTINTPYLPIAPVSTASFSSAAVFTSAIRSNGGITSRNTNASSYSSGVSYIVTFFYITE